MDIMTGVGLVCGIDRHRDPDAAGRRSGHVRLRTRRHHHLRRLDRGDHDPFSARRHAAWPAARRQIRLHDEPAVGRATSSTSSPASPRSPASRARSALEKVEADDPFLAKGIRYVADGYDLEFIRDNLERDRDNFLMHLDEGSKIYRAIGDCAPAFGMIGTLVGMVQMFANMTDPSKLGPFMATALLATLYGALVANLFCLPIADKLHGKLLDEETNRTLIIDGILMIRDSKSPALVREMLLAYLPEKHRHEEGEPVPA